MHLAWPVKFSQPDGWFVLLSQVFEFVIHAHAGIQFLTNVESMQSH